MYAAVTTRVNIAYAVNKVSRCVVDPTTNNWKAVKQILKYLKDKKFGLTYSSTTDQGLIAFCDAFQKMQPVAGQLLDSFSCTVERPYYGRVRDRL